MKKLRLGWCPRKKKARLYTGTKIVLPDTASDNLREKQQGVPKSFGIGDRGGLNPPVVFTVKCKTKLTKLTPLGVGSSRVYTKKMVSTNFPSTPLGSSCITSPFRLAWEISFHS